MSAIAALLAVIEGGWHWDALVLFDPTVVPPPGHPLRGPLLAAGEINREAARNRQSWFSDPTELAEVFRTLHWFRRIRKGVAEITARSTLRFVPADGAWEPYCPGPVEAGLYTDVAALPIWQEAGPPARPMLIVGSDPELDGALKTAQRCVEFGELHGIDYASVPDTTHLLQAEEPEQCFTLFAGFLAEHGLTE